MAISAYRPWTSLLRLCFHLPFDFKAHTHTVMANAELWLAVHQSQLA
jgi:hypothetical protein